MLITVNFDDVVINSWYWQNVFFFLHSDFMSDDIQAFLPSTRGCRIYALKTWQKLRRWTLSCAVLSDWVSWVGVNPYASCIQNKSSNSYCDIVTLAPDCLSKMYA